VQLATGFGLIHAKRIEFRDLMQESLLRRHRHHHATIHQQNRLTKLQVPGSKRESLALECRDGEIRPFEEIEHRLMHAETLAYMLHQLPFNQKVANPRLPELLLRPVMPRMLEIPAGQATLGLARCRTDIFGWDNEYEEHTVAVPPFSIDQYEVTNREYLQFIDASGYEDQSLWSDSDWKWKKQQNISFDHVRQNGKP